MTDDATTPTNPPISDEPTRQIVGPTLDGLHREVSNLKADVVRLEKELKKLQAKVDICIGDVREATAVMREVNTKLDETMGKLELSMRHLGGEGDG
jgi:predicted RNase H-like nuclease (RuvC/YqgF family)